MAKIKVALARRNPSKRERLVTGFVITTAMVILWVKGTSGANEPNLISVKPLGETQIKVTWQSLTHEDSDKQYLYKLYIDDHLEYFGKDVMYIVRRLTPDSIYHFKLRWCVRVKHKHHCSPFSKTLSGTTAQSRKRGFTKSFIQWTVLCVVTILATTTAVLARKISKRLWRLFLYKYDYWSETNLQLPKFTACTDNIDEDLMSSLNLKTFPESEGRKKCEHVQSGEQCCTEYSYVGMQNYNLTNDPRTGVSDASSLTTKYNPFHAMEDTEIDCNMTDISYSKDNDFWKPAAYSQETRSNENAIIESNPGHGVKLATVSTCNILNTLELEYNLEMDFDVNHVKHNENSEATKLRFKRDKNENLVLWRAPTSPKTTLLSNSKRKNKYHKRAKSLDDNIQSEIFRSQCLKRTRNIPHYPARSTNKLSTNLVIVVDNSNIFIGAQECAGIIHPNERKRNIRVKIQQLVKVFQRGRIVSRAFVQGSSPPLTEQVWEVYRHLGYCVDVEERRGKDEQRVDEGLHLHIYKALFELSPRVLVIASGDGNKGKSECETSMPGCAKAALRRGWKVEVYSWQRSTSMEWIKLSKKYPEMLTTHYLDRYLNHITFVDGKHGRKCQPFPPHTFQENRGNLTKF